METLRPNTTNIALINNDVKQARQLGISLGNMGYHVSHFSSAVSALQDKNLDNIKLFYGGSVDASNINELLDVELIDGFLIGSASANFEKFRDIVKQIKL